MDYVTILGLAAASCTTFAFLPQAIKVWKTRHTKDLSLALFLMFTLGVVLWLIYGLLIDSIPVIVANAVTFVLAGTILMFKLKYG